ncbi:MAG: hypothetical protein RLW87_21505 [Alphaproteobacteria bacterium]
MCRSDRSAIGRVLYAVEFEFLPVVAYTYVFTLAYDRLFPVRPRAAMAG